VELRRDVAGRKDEHAAFVRPPAFVQILIGFPAAMENAAGFGPCFVYSAPLAVHTVWTADAGAFLQFRIVDGRHGAADGALAALAARNRSQSLALQHSQERMPRNIWQGVARP